MHTIYFFLIDLKNSIHPGRLPVSEELNLTVIVTAYTTNINL